MSASQHSIAKPFLKWAGGKRQLLPTLSKHLPPVFDRYIEPFLGGGALFFYLHNKGLLKKAFLGDINETLILTYAVVKKHPTALIKELNTYTYSKTNFYDIRQLDRDPEYNQLSDIKKAARFIYLNKTCYNGLYRVNASGQFNTPFGNYKQPLICDDINLKAVSKALRSTTLKHASFNAISSTYRPGDFVYLDPPYDPVSSSANFTSYVAEKFDTSMQKKLKSYCDKLHKKGAYFMVSNSATPFIKDLYQSYNVQTVSAKRSINSNAKKRGLVDEVIVTNYLPNGDIQ